MSEGQSSNVKPLFADQEIKTDREKDLINYLAGKLAAARESGLNVDSIVFCLVGEMTKGDVSHPDGTALHYWIAEDRHVSKELSFVEKLIANEVNRRIDDMEEA